MPAPTPSWNLVRVYGTWRNQDGTKKLGSYRVTIPQRVSSAVDDTMIPAGVYLNGSLSVTAGTSPSLDIQVPAVDDPDISPNGFDLDLVVTFNDGTPAETFKVRPSINGPDVNLRQYVFPSSTPTPSPLLIRGVPGGLAELDAAGDVVDAAGNKVIGGGGGTSGPVAAADITDATTVGRSVLTATSAANARSALGAGTSSLVIGTTATSAKAGNWNPTAANITDATAVGRNVLTAASQTAARNAIDAASSAQGAKADTAVQAADLQAEVQEALDGLGVRVDQLIAYNDSALNTKLAALPVGTVVGIVGPEVV